MACKFGCAECICGDKCNCGCPDDCEDQCVAGAFCNCYSEASGCIFGCPACECDNNCSCGCPDDCDGCERNCNCRQR